MRKSVRLFILILLASFGLSRGASALVGIVDEDDQFPFVVRIETQWTDGSNNWSNWCSGVVHGHLLSTAAHCIWDSKFGGFATRVEVPFVDVSGNQQRARSRRLYIPRAYIEADKQHSHDFEGAIHDIGYVVLDRDVLVKGYVHWGLELLDGIPDGASTCAEPECEDWTLTGARKDAFLENIKRELGDVSKVKMRIIGFGNYTCSDFSQREQNCESDGRRRYVELPALSIVPDKPPPWLWCTGQDEAGINPVQHGDSGGPVFVQALDGRWLYVGYTSRGDPTYACASSVFNDLNLFVRASGAYDGEIQGAPLVPSREDIDKWFEVMARQFFFEWLNVESAPNDVAVGNLDRLYGRTVEYFGRSLNRDDVRKDKTAYYQRWPQRTFDPSDVTVFCDDPTTTFGQRTCSVSALLSWTVKSDQAARSGTSNVTLSLFMPSFFSRELTLGDLNPIVSGEAGGVIRRDRSTVAHSIRSDVPDGYANLRMGAGLDFAVVARVPAGQVVTIDASRCHPATDKTTKFPWCAAIWKDTSGWVSTFNLSN